MATTLAPISYASIIVGFISFSFTLAIWIQASWDAFLTIGSAPEQVQDTLSTLRQGLYEEREFLRRRRRQKGGRRSGIYHEGGSARVMHDAVRDLIRTFKILEHPFLLPPHEGREKDLEWSFDATQQRYNCGLGHRILWLRVKGRVDDIAVRLQRIQTRRIEAIAEEQQYMVADMMGMVREYEDRLGAIEHRLQMSRIG